MRQGASSAGVLLTRVSSFFLDLLSFLKRVSRQIIPFVFEHEILCHKKTVLGVSQTVKSEAKELLVRKCRLVPCDRGRRFRHAKSVQGENQTVRYKVC